MAGQDALFERPLHAFVDGCDVLGGNRLVIDVVNELVAFARFVRFDAQFAVGVVAGPSCLPYVFAFPFSMSANGLQINHPWFANVQLDFEFVQDAVASHFQMQFIHPADDGLPAEKLCLDLDGGVFLGDDLQGALELLVVAIAPWDDGHGYYGTGWEGGFAHGAPLFVRVQCSSRIKSVMRFCADEAPSFCGWGFLNFAV